MITESKIEKAISNEISNGRKVLSVFLTAGYPDKNGFVDVANAVLDAGADMLELGVPFSDPIADGSVIQHSSQVAISNGVNMQTCLDLAKTIKSRSSKPIILMGYANPIFRFGTNYFINTLKSSGVDGVIIPDLPIEEYDEFFDGESPGVDTIHLVTPTSPDNRIKIIAERSTGFVYCVSVKGITGERNNFNENSINYIKHVKNIIPDHKVLVGFGISNPETAKLFSENADGVIIGSAIIKLLSQSNGNLSEGIEFVKSIKEAISG